MKCGRVRRWGSVVRLRPETRLGSRGRCGAVASVRARDAGTLPPNRWDTSRSQAEPMRRWASEKADHIVCQVPPTSSYDGDCGTARAALVRILGPVRATDVGPPFRPLDGPLGFLLHSLSDCLPKRPCACQCPQRAAAWSTPFRIVSGTGAEPSTDHRVSGLSQRGT